ncbi:MAG: hypothetical protein KF768_03640 [Phycisphaeraceae bacterium]|nr:hypothetical protein [Phycisphaeraceae bacterium]
MMKRWKRWRGMGVAGVVGVVVAAGLMGVGGVGERAGEAGGEGVGAEDVSEAMSAGVRMLLSMQEGPPVGRGGGGGNRAEKREAEEGAEVGREWPYEGVYRVRGEIPIGYRVGGTAICGLALVRAPGYAGDEDRRGAVARGLGFIIEALDHPLMSPDYDGGYDVRGWGYTYALLFVLALLEEEGARVPAGRTAEELRALAQRLVGAIEETEIAQVGGWNYARGRGKETVSPPSPFMTGPTLQALFEAERAGLKVDAGVVERGLECLDRSRTRTGSVVYSGVEGARSGEPVPGSVGRMLVTETTLELAGRGSVERVRGAVDAFFTHWEWLEARRAKTGTHERPYGVAPYYFFFAHYYAAQAIERLPRRDREEYRRRLAKTIFSVRDGEGGWNDRVFPRSANYGTAMSMMALGMGDAPRPAGWAGKRGGGAGEVEGAREGEGAGATP